MKALNLDPVCYSPQARALLEAAGLTMDDGPMSRSALEECIASYDVILLRFAHRLDEALLRRASRLRIIGTNTTGLDHIDTSTTETLGIAVVSLRDDTEFLAQIHSSAELTWALLLMLERRLVAATRAVEQGRWQRDRHLGRELAGQRLGILGYGRIGRRVAHYAKAFGMTVHAFDLIRPREAEAGTIWHDRLPEMLAAVDILSVHLPLNDRTAGLVDHELLSAMRPGTRLINTARAGIVDEAALVAALRSGHLGGAAVDVLPFETEPDCPRSSDLWRLAQSDDRIVITPHLGGATRQAWQRTELHIAKKVIAAMQSLPKS